jgi:hypothetical protein
MLACLLAFVIIGLIIAISIGVYRAGSDTPPVVIVIVTVVCIGLILYAFGNLREAARERDRDPEIDRGIREGFGSALDYFFPERTFVGKILGVLGGFVISLITGVILDPLFERIFDDPTKGAVIETFFPVAYHLTKTYNLFRLETMAQAYALGAAFWTAFVIGSVTMFITKWLANAILDL